MDDSQKIDNLIRVMETLQLMCQELDNRKINHKLTLYIMMEIIMSTPIPDVTILPNNRELAFA
tara:strand:+ start:287 stop:475 length:189 start_codon:yes stop_codon:yes gene_type:complete